MISKTESSVFKLGSEITSMPVKAVKGLIKKLSLVFYEAIHHIEPLFNEAAEGEGERGGGAKFHGMGPIGIPGAKFHAMTGQAEGTADIRRMRAEGRAFSAEVAGRPDYYSDYANVNSLKM